MNNLWKKAYFDVYSGEALEQLYQIEDQINEMEYDFKNDDGYVPLPTPEALLRALINPPSVLKEMTKEKRKVLYELAMEFGEASGNPDNV